MIVSQFCNNRQLHPPSSTADTGKEVGNVIVSQVCKHRQLQPPSSTAIVAEYICQLFVSVNVGGVANFKTPCDKPFTINNNSIRESSLSSLRW